jgi:2-polyprenyl-3-methyl-5-hydroxy-6-metoxy-1,4-benzoquinol methylase
MSDFDELKKLLMDDKWSKAIPDKLICDINSEEDKNLRADEIVLSMVTVMLEGKKVLDFGCGQGHILKRMAQEKVNLAIGYDLVASGPFEWEKDEQTLLTTSWEKVVQSGPYDVILVYDVLDHVTNQSPIEALKLIRSVATTATKIYVRCHPWCGTHGGHLYTEINKAYIHLVFSDSELQELGYTPIPTAKVIRPQSTYTKWAKEAGFSDEIKYVIVADTPSGFFKQTPQIKKRIKQNLRSDKWPLLQLRQSFVDFNLKVV